jgi:hypothetical protein
LSLPGIVAGVETGAVVAHAQVHAVVAQLQRQLDPVGAEGVVLARSGVLLVRRRGLARREAPTFS